jgi:hypothetical protein
LAARSFFSVDPSCPFVACSSFLPAKESWYEEESGKMSQQPQKKKPFDREHKACE